MNDNSNSPYLKTNEMSQSIIPNQKRWLIDTTSSKNLSSSPFIKKTVKSSINPWITFDDGTTAHINDTFPILNKNNLDEGDMADIEVFNDVDIINNLNNRLRKKKSFTRVEETLLLLGSIKDNREYRQIESTQMKDKQQLPHIQGIVLDCIEGINVNQMIIFHGEDSLGKTEAFDYTLRCINDYYGKDNQLINMNRVLEAFGNAITMYNSNSSRLGKYISIKVDTKTKSIKGCYVVTFSLEKSRIINHSTYESNYYIFYYLINGCDERTLNRLKLTKNTSTYAYLKHIEHIDQTSIDTLKKNKENYKELIISLMALGFNSEDIDGILTILAVTLLLGNITIDMNNSSSPLQPTELFENISNLLGVNQHFLQMVLTRKPPSFSSKEYGSMYNEQVITSNIKTLAQELFSKLFDWIVKKINNELSPVCIESHSEVKHIGLIDLCGFQDNTSSNSIEQLYINYINEQLHRLYTQHCFEDDKLEYKREGLEGYINDINIKYQTNRSLIKQLKLFINQTRECQNDSQIQSIGESFDLKLKDSEKGDAKIHLNDYSKKTILINHSHDDIEYSIDNYVKSNNNELNNGIIDCVLSSSQPIIQMIFTNSITDSQMVEAKQQILKERLKPDPKKRLLTNLGMRYLMQWRELKSVIKKSKQHYVICIKPNKEKTGGVNLWPNYVYNQLKCFNIPTLIAYKRDSWSVIYSYEQFYHKYHLVLNGTYNRNENEEYLKQIQMIIERVIKDESNDNDFLFGKSKLFFKRRFNKEFVLKANRILFNKELSCNVIKTAIHHHKQRTKLNIVDQKVKYIQEEYSVYRKKKQMKYKRSMVNLIQAAYKQYADFQPFKMNQMMLSNIRNGLKIITASKRIESLNQNTIMIVLRMSIYLNNLHTKNYQMMTHLSNELINDSIKVIKSNEYSHISNTLSPFIQMFFTRKRHQIIITSIKQQMIHYKKHKVITMFQERHFLYNIRKRKESALSIVLHSNVTQLNRYYTIIRYNTLLIQAYLKYEPREAFLHMLIEDYSQREDSISQLNKDKANSLFFPNESLTVIDKETNKATGHHSNGCDSFFEDNEVLQLPINHSNYNYKSTSLSNPLHKANLIKSQSMYNQRQVQLLYHNNTIDKMNSKVKIQITSTILDYDVISNTEAYMNWAQEYLYYFDINLKCNTPLINIQAGNTHTLAINSKGQVFSWGWNDYNQCAKAKSTQPKPIEEIITYNEDGWINDLPQIDYHHSGEHIAKGIIGQCSQVIAGEDYSLFLSENGNVYSVGNNNKGQLGLSNFKPVNGNLIQMNKMIGETQVIKGIYSAGSFNVLLTNDNKMLAWFISKNKMAIKPMRLFIEQRMIINQIACGKNFMIVLDSNGLVYGSGTNTHGELGSNDPSNRLIPEEISSINSLHEAIIQIRCGYKHVIALSSNGKVYGWGNNTYGQLGHSNADDNTVTDIEVLHNQRVVQVACGFRSSIYLTSSRLIYYSGTLSKENESKTSKVFNYKSKSNESNGASMIPVKILTTWNQSFSIFYALYADLRLSNIRIKEKIIEDIVTTLTSHWLNDSIYAPYLEKYSHFFN